MKDRSKHKEYMKEYNRKNRPRLLKMRRQWHKDNRVTEAAYNRTKYKQLKDAVMSHYGGSCAVCGITDLAFLTIDHIDGGGKKHRKEIGRDKMYEWTVKNDFPPGFQVLCWNHNWLKYTSSLKLESDSLSTKRNKRNRRYRRKLKLMILSHYGGRCTCCGETNLDVLTIDHINNDGAEHRRESKCGYGSVFYKWLRDCHFPSGFQVLCFNCNSGRVVNGGVCPHTEC